MDANEAKVRAVWKNIAVYSYGGATRYVYLADLCFEFSGIDEPAAWAAAAEFTAGRQQAIADVDEEIALLEGVSTTTAAFISSIYVAKHIKQDSAKEAPVWKRILASRQSARAELTRGMVGA